VDKALTCGSAVQPYVVVVGDVDGQDSTLYNDQQHSIPVGNSN